MKTATNYQPRKFGMPAQIKQAEDDNLSIQQKAFSKMLGINALEAALEQIEDQFDEEEDLQDDCAAAFLSGFDIQSKHTALKAPSRHDTGDTI